MGAWGTVSMLAVIQWFQNPANIKYWCNFDDNTRAYNTIVPVCILQNHSNLVTISMANSVLGTLLVGILHSGVSLMIGSVLVPRP